MGRSKRNKYNNENKKGHYKKDHSYIDFSDEDASGMYDDGKVLTTKIRRKRIITFVLDHISIASSSSGEISDESTGKQEEDFIALTEEVVDDRSRQQKRFEERAQLKRKRDETDEEEDENALFENRFCYPWVELMNFSRFKQPLSAHRL